MNNKSAKHTKVLIPRDPGPIAWKVLLMQKVVTSNAQILQA